MLNLRDAHGAERQLLQVCQLREYEWMFLKSGIVRMLYGCCFGARAGKNLCFLASVCWLEISPRPILLGYDTKGGYR